MRNVLVKLLVVEFKVTKRDKFIGITWLLHKTYLEKMLEKYSMHAHQIWHVLKVKGDEIRNRKFPWISERSIKWNKFQVLQLSEV
jgi:hypothetical protein